MVKCQSAHLACICRLYFVCQDTDKALPLACQLALQRTWHSCEQVAIAICMHKESQGPLLLRCLRAHVEF